MDKIAVPYKEREIVYLHSFGPPCGVDNGKKWRRYIFEYYHDEAWWGIDIPAWSQEDAQMRINKISWARYVGEHFYTIKAKSRFLAGLICMVKNMWK